MKEKTNIDVVTLKIIYEKYKQHIIYGSIVLVSVLIFVIFTMPMISDIAGLGKARKIESDKLEILSRNLTLLASLDSNVLDSQLKTTSSALPGNKDFEGVLNAISTGASKSGASLSDYNFSVGSILEKDTSTAGYPFIQVELSLQATPAQLVSFLKNISETVPLSEVISINQNSGTAKITIVFYYKSFLPSNFENGNKLAGISSADRIFIDTISSWDTLSFSTIPVGSASASNLASPF